MDAKKPSSSASLFNLLSSCRTQFSTSQETSDDNMTHERSRVSRRRITVVLHFSNSLYPLWHIPSDVIKCWIKDSGWKQGVWIKNPILKKRNYFQVHCHTGVYFFSPRPKETTIQPSKNCYPKLPSTLCTLQSWEMGSWPEIPERPTWNPNPTVSIPLIFDTSFGCPLASIKNINFQVHKCWFQSRATLFDHWSWHFVVARKKTKKNCIQTKVTTVEIHGPTFYYNG